MKTFHDMLVFPMGMEECAQLIRDLMELPIEYIAHRRPEFEDRIYNLGVGFAETGIDEFSKEDEPLVAKFADWLDDVYEKLGDPGKSIAKDFRLTVDDVRKILSQ